MIRTGALCTWISLIASSAMAQGPSVQLQLGSANLEVGESVDAKLICTNVNVVGAPNIPTIPGLKLILLNETPNRSSMTSIVNGRTSQSTTYTFSLQVSALAEGNHVIPSLTVSDVDGRSFSTQSVGVIVRRPAVESGAKGDRYLFAELTVNPTSLYVTQTVEAVLVIGIRRVVINGQPINLNLLRDVLDVNGCQLSVFANGRATQSNTSLVDSTGVRNRYELFEVRKEIRAEQVGTLSIGPIFLRANYPMAVREGFFGYEVTRVRKETARADEIRVVVKGAPDAGRPADFTGAIGVFEMDVTATPKRVEQGRPVTLTVAIRGAPLDGVAGPILAASAELVSRFDFAKEEPVGDLEGDARVFRRALFPRQVGEQTIPSISWSYFDPTHERYVTLVGEAIPVSVDPPSTNLANMTVSPDIAAPIRPMLKAVTGGMMPNHADVDQLLATQAMPLTAPWIAVLVISPMAYALTALLARQRRRLRDDPQMGRRRRAARNARRALHAVSGVEHRVARAEALAGLLRRYLADRFGLPSGSLTSSDAREVLLSAGVDSSLAGDVASFLDACDALRYSPHSADGASFSDSPPQIHEWIETMERTAR